MNYGHGTQGSWHRVFDWNRVIFYPRVIDISKQKYLEKNSLHSLIFFMAGNCVWHSVFSNVIFFKWQSIGICLLHHLSNIIKLNKGLTPFTWNSASTSSGLMGISTARSATIWRSGMWACASSCLLASWSASAATFAVRTPWRPTTVNYKKIYKADLMPQFFKFF